MVSTEWMDLNFNELRLMLQEWITSIKIIRDFSYFVDYYTTLKQVALKTDRGKWKTILIRVQQLVLLWGALYSAFIYAYDGDLPDQIKLFTCNVMYLTGFDASFHLCIVCFLLLAAYYQQLMYVRNNGFSSQMMYALLIKQQNGTTAHSRLLYLCREKSRQEIREKRMKNPNYVIKTIPEHLKEMSVWIANYFLLLSISNAIQFVCVQYEAFNEFASKGYFETWFGWFGYVTFQFFAFGSALTLNLAFSASSLVAIFGLLVMTVGYIRVHHIERYMNEVPPERFDSTRVKRIMEQTCFGVANLANSNRIYGSALYGFILVNIPMNAVFMNVLMAPKVTLVWKLFLGILALFQVMFLFCVHFWAALFAQNMHRQTKKMIKVSIHSRRINDSRTKIKLERYIELFHSRNQHTVCYGKYGKITMATFFKFVFYYLKFLVFAYKLHQMTLN